MSLARIRIAARLLAVAAMAALTAGCFQPMYAEHADGTPGLRDKLLGVELPPVEKPNASPEARIGELELLNAEEQEQIVSGWNLTHREYPKDKSIHDLFEEQVEKTPEAIAVVCGEERQDPEVSCQLAFRRRVGRQGAGTFRGRANSLSATSSMAATTGPSRS